MKTHKKLNLTIIRRTSYIGLLLLTFCAISLVEANAQNSNHNPNDKEGDYNCVEVSLTANSNRLEKRNPIVLRVRIENFCNRTIEIMEPSFTIDKSQLETTIRFGDRRGARIIRTKGAAIDNTAKPIAQHKFLDFIVNTNELRWMDSLQANEVFLDLFTDHELKSGSYQLYAEITVYPISKQHFKAKGGKVTQILSNKIEVLFEG